MCGVVSLDGGVIMEKSDIINDIKNDITNLNNEIFQQVATSNGGHTSVIDVVFESTINTTSDTSSANLKSLDEKVTASGTK
jgi:hypothetical protein